MQQHENDDEESKVFASLHATAIDQGAYEQQVVGTAGHDSIVPPLLLTPDHWGFTTPILRPLLGTTAPSAAASSTVELLERLLQQLDHRAPSSKSDTDVTTMKRHILEHALTEARQHLIQEEKTKASSAIDLTDDTTDAPKRRRTLDSSTTSSTTTMKRARIPIMERKQAPTAPSHHQRRNATSVMTPEQAAQLQAWRAERKRRKEQRRVQWSSDDDEEDAEMDEEEVAKTDDTSARTSGATDESNLEMIDIAPATTRTASTAVTCPICSQTLEVMEAASTISVDAYLAQHMQSCTGAEERPRRRSTRTSSSTAGAAVDPLQSVVTWHMEAPSKPKPKKQSFRQLRSQSSQPDDDSFVDDYEDRVDAWVAEQTKPKDAASAATPADSNSILLTATDESITLPGGLWAPPWIYSRLFPYQRVGFEWLWQLHQNGNVGEIVGDEMGLGKTVQVAAFLGAAVASRKLKSVLIVAPGTLLEHWMRELAIWAPGLRRILARSTAPPTLSSMQDWLQHARRERWNEALDDADWEDHSAWCGTGYCIVTTYEQVRRHRHTFYGSGHHTWSYVVLDEAQHIRNPDAEVTMACKQVRTRHRLAMTGTPIQNDLRELWSLVDFCFPGRLGTLPAFEQEFAVPIKRGGYANASPVQVQLAYRCALQVRELVEPYLLRRLKRDIPEVQKMPGKTEQVLFCRLSAQQREMYEAYLQSDDVLRMVGRRRQADNRHQLLKATTVLRKITNHPDLVCDPDDMPQFVQTCGGNMAAGNNDDSDEDSAFGDDALQDSESMVARSGKLEVLSKILPLWYKQGHRVLIFCQWRKMLDIIQRFITLKGYKFGRLDGNTNIASRQNLVDTFNNDKSYMGLLCTTRTGGVGLNLTGADRIILYDPDWNPSSDAQARERAWRFGQTRPVTVYRLITAGTIEEKMYHRQIFKTALSNKILQDPRQRRLFSQRDLCDLFTLGSDTGSVRGGGDGVTDTALATQGVGNVTDETDERVTLADKRTDDNDLTLKKVMKSQGLAGIFDHDVIEPGAQKKNGTEIEIEKHAKQVAKDAVKALMSSVRQRQLGVPTWTGSAETMSKPRFGNRTKSVSMAEPLSSTSLLGSIRTQNASVRTDGIVSVTNDDNRGKDKYTALLGRVQAYVRRENPTTDELLKEFDEIPESEMAIFRRLLKSVASMDQHGRWLLASLSDQG